MRYFLWKLLGKCFWIKLNSHYAHPKTGQKYYGEWEQKKRRIRNNLSYKLIGCPNPKEQKA